MPGTETMTATDFKATCLEVLDRVQSGQVRRVEVTQRGQVVAVLTAPTAATKPAQPLHGALRGRVFIPDGFDLTAPTMDETSDAESGILHR